MSRAIRHQWLVFLAVDVALSAQMVVARQNVHRAFKQNLPSDRFNSRRPDQSSTGPAGIAYFTKTTVGLYTFQLT